jgi:predicted LPLAT superfamily acyltransferase
MNKFDLLQVGKIAAFTTVAWLTPPRLWRKAAAATAHFGTYGADLSVYQRIFGPTFDKNAASLLNYRRRICRYEARLQILGLKGIWRSWWPDIRLHGDAELRKALNNGRGAILWVTESAYSALILKMALNSAGYRASQLTRPGHGFSNSPFGIRFLNPLWTNVEDRFIDERVAIQGDNAASALAILRARLAANRVVNIAVYTKARKFVEVPFFHHSIQLPTGPIRLMRETGAPLLPAFVFASDKHFDVTIESALPPSDKRGAFDSTATAYAKLLESYVRKYPEQWMGWDYIFDLH